MNRKLPPQMKYSEFIKQYEIKTPDILTRVGYFAFAVSPEGRLIRVFVRYNDNEDDTVVIL